MEVTNKRRKTDRGICHVVDLVEKLDYLQEIAGGSGHDNRGSLVRVYNQETLAAVLRIDTSEISRWRKTGSIKKFSRIGPMLEEIFRIDLLSFRYDNFDVFEQKHEAVAVSWDTLIESAPITGSIVPVLPLGLSMRQSGPSDVAFEVTEDTRLSPGDRFRVIFTAPTGTMGQRWRGRHVYLFSGDDNGYQSWLPGFRESKAFQGIETFPRTSHVLEIPSVGGSLNVGVTAHGKHQVVLVLTQERLPTVLHEKLVDERKGLQTTTLKQLAHWLFQRRKDGRADIARSVFLVGN